MSRLGIVLVLLSSSSLAAEKSPVVDLTPQIEEILEEITEVQYLDTPLGDIATDLELRHKVNIELDGEALAADGNGSDLPLTKTLKGVPLASALDLLLAPQGLAWTIHDDVLLITTQTADMTSYARTKLHAVGDLEEDPKKLIDIVTQSLEPDSWRCNGGNVGAIVPHESSKSLVVTHTTKMHREVAKLLDKLREANEKSKK